MPLPLATQALLRTLATFSTEETKVVLGFTRRGIVTVDPCMCMLMHIFMHMHMCTVTVHRRWTEEPMHIQCLDSQPPRLTWPRAAMQAHPLVWGHPPAPERAALAAWMLKRGCGGGLMPGQSHRSHRLRLSRRRHPGEARFLASAKREFREVATRDMAAVDHTPRWSVTVLRGALEK